MSKSIAILETPYDCLECMFMRECGVTSTDKPFTYKQLYNCALEPEHYNEDEERYIDYLNDYMEYGNKPDWCPLKKLPEKKGETKTLSKEYNKEKNLIAKGYNLCISHILGEELPNF